MPPAGLASTVSHLAAALLVLLLLASAQAATLRQLEPTDLQKRIPETPKPYLIPDVMKVDQEQKH